MAPPQKATTLLMNLLVPLLLLLLTALAGFAYSQVHQLSLPISTALSILIVLHPLLTLLLLYLTPSSPALNPFTTVHLIFTTVLLSRTSPSLFRSPILSCLTSTRWSTLYTTKNAPAVRAIQDALQCCGFHTLRDRAWPFQSPDIDAGRCVATFGYTRACELPWIGRERLVAGLMIIVLIGGLGIEAAMLFVIWRRRGGLRYTLVPSVAALMGPDGGRVQRRIPETRTMTDDCQDCETGNAHYVEEEAYRDEVEQDERNGMRIMPSGVGTGAGVESGSDPWRNEVC